MCVGDLYNEEEEKLIAKFYEKGADLDAQNEHGESILHNAVYAYLPCVVCPRWRRATRYLLRKIPSICHVQGAQIFIGVARRPTIFV